MFALWLDPMSDGTFPNINLIMGVLECINNLNVKIELDEDSSLYRIIDIYSKSMIVAPQAMRLALQIHDKWDREIQGEGAYDESDDENFEAYRRY
jgi:hypothetical protein